MAKFTFDKSAKAKKRTPNPIAKTEIAKPEETYDPSKAEMEMSKPATSAPKQKRLGRPKSGRKEYTVARLQKKTVLKINALENTLSLKNQDELVDRALDRILNSLDNDEKRAYELWLEVLEKKEDK